MSLSARILWGNQGIVDRRLMISDLWKDSLSHKSEILNLQLQAVFYQMYFLNPAKPFGA